MIDFVSESLELYKIITLLNMSALYADPPLSGFNRVTKTTLARLVNFQLKSNSSRRKNLLTFILPARAWRSTFWIISPRVADGSLRQNSRRLLIKRYEVVRLYYLNTGMRATVTCGETIGLIPRSCLLFPCHPPQLLSAPGELPCTPATPPRAPRQERRIAQTTGDTERHAHPSRVSFVQSARG